MKGLKMSLLVVLFLGIFLQHSYSARGPNIGQDCCNTYVKGAIPFSKLVSWSKTSISCRKEAIVFVTVLKKSICVNPNEKWVKAATRFLKIKNNKKTNSGSEINSGPQNLNLLKSEGNLQTPINNSTQAPSKTQVNPSQQTNSTQYLNSISPINSSIHLRN